MKRKTSGLKTQGVYKNILNTSKQILFLNVVWIFFALTLEQVGAGVGIEGRVSIICPKAAPLGYEYVVVTLYLFNNGDQKITTNPSG